MWDAKEFTFLKPLHVEPDIKLNIDEPLLAALLAGDGADRVPYEAIVEFNRANTDSPDIPIHTEIVMIKSAFEFLLGVRHEADESVSALYRTFRNSGQRNDLMGLSGNAGPSAEVIDR